jgi:hypothetical protein
VRISKGLKWLLITKASNLLLHIVTIINNTASYSYRINCKASVLTELNLNNENSNKKATYSSVISQQNEVDSVELFSATDEVLEFHLSCFYTSSRAINVSSIFNTSLCNSNYFSHSLMANLLL